jgi:hypothetical protein
VALLFSPSSRAEPSEEPAPDFQVKKKGASKGARLPGLF